VRRSFKKRQDLSLTLFFPLEETSLDIPRNIACVHIFIFFLSASQIFFQSLLSHKAIPFANIDLSKAVFHSNHQIIEILSQHVCYDKEKYFQPALFFSKKNPLSLKGSSDILQKSSG
jgi:hypothetical protein